jgi:hypothetical protein
MAAADSCRLSWSEAVSCTHEPLLEASIEMAGKLAPGRQSCHGVNARADARGCVVPGPWVEIRGCGDA